MANFFATLTGAQEVPPVQTMATGRSRLSLNPAQTVLEVLLEVSMINQVREAHIHLGRPGENGPIVLFLFESAVPVNIGRSGLLTNRTFTAANLIGPLQGQPLSALAREMLAGNTYVNVHTTRFPAGEIRGQVVPQ